MLEKRGNLLTIVVAVVAASALFIIRGATAGSGAGSTLWGHYHVSPGYRWRLRRPLRPPPLR